MNIIRQHVPGFVDADPQTISFAHISELYDMDDPFILRFIRDTFNHYFIKDDLLMMNLGLEENAKDFVAGFIIEHDENIHDLESLATIDYLFKATRNWDTPPNIEKIQADMRDPLKHINYMYPEVIQVMKIDKTTIGE